MVRFLFFSCDTFYVWIIIVFFLFDILHVWTCFQKTDHPFLVWFLYFLSNIFFTYESVSKERRSSISCFLLFSRNICFQKPDYPLYVCVTHTTLNLSCKRSFLKRKKANRKLKNGPSVFCFNSSTSRKIKKRIRFLYSRAKKIARYVKSKPK